MAKMEKEEENIENNDGFNDIDENFGLPDLELEPLDDSDSSADDVAEKPQEVVEEELNEVGEGSVEETYSFESDTNDLEEDNSEGSSDEVEYSEPEATYVPGSYAAKVKEENSSSGKTIGIVVIILVIIAIAVGWYFYNQSQIAADKAKQEQIAAKQAQEEKDRIAKEEAAKEERLRAEEEARLQLQAEEDAKPKIGTIETIYSATSRYYVVVSSGLDGDLAMDYAKKEVNNGTNIKLLSPLGKNKFYRVSVGDYDTWAEAENAVNDLKSTFGESIWILKY